MPLLLSTLKKSGSLQPGPLPAGTTVTASQVSDSTALGQELIKSNTPTDAQTSLGLTSTVSSAATALQPSAIGTTVAGLTGGKIPVAQIPSVAIVEYLGTVASQTAMLALTGQQGDWCTRTDLGTTWIISGGTPSQLSSWTQLSYPAAAVTSVAGMVGAVTLTKNDISGLGTAASSAVEDFATAAQGSLANTALQPGVLPVGTTLPFSQVTGLPAVATSLLAETTVANQRTRLGLGTAATLNTSSVVQAVNNITPDGSGNVNTRVFDANVIGAAPVVISLATLLLSGAPHTLVVNPDTGCTIAIEYSTNGGSTYSTLSSITSSKTYTYTLKPGEVAITHVRLSRTAGSSVASNYSISGGIQFAQYPAGTPAGSVSSESITDATSIGKQVLTATDAAQARTYLGVGTGGSSTVDGITDAGATGKAVLSSQTQTDARTALGLGTAATLASSVLVKQVNGRTPDGNGNVITRTFDAGAVGATDVIIDLSTLLLVGAPHVLTVTPDTGCTIEIARSSDSGSTYTVQDTVTTSSSLQYIRLPGEASLTHIRLRRTVGTSTSSTYAISGGIDYAQYPEGAVPGGTSTVAAADITDATDLGRNLLKATDTTQAQDYLGLGSAAVQSVSTFATFAQGAKADSALQSSDIGTTVAGLTGGKLSTSVLPDLAIVDYLGSVANQTAMLALTGQKGDWCIRNDTGTSWIITGPAPSSLGSWTELSYPTSPVTSVAGKTGAVVLSTADISGIGAYGSSFVALTTRQDALNNLAGAATSGYVMRGNGTNVVMGAIQAADVPTLNQNTTGSAATLTTARNISITGDATWTVSFNGGENVSAALTLANSGVTAGTYSAPSIDVDAKGRITGITSQSVVKSVNNATPDGSGNVNTVQSTSGTIGASAVFITLSPLQLLGLPHVLTISPDAGCTIEIAYSTNNGTSYSVLTSISSAMVYQYTVAANESAVTNLRLTRSAGTSTASTYSVSGGTNLVQYPSNATVYVRPSTSLTQTVVDNATPYGASLLSKANNADLGIAATDLTGVSSIGQAVLSATTPSQAQSAIGLSTTLSPTSYIFVGSYANTTDLQTAYPAASYNGYYALVGASAPRAVYKSNGTSWVSTGTNAASSGGNDTTVGFTLATPSYIQTSGGWIYVDGAGGGGGGGGGNASTSTTGGGGGGAARGCNMLPLYIPAGTTSLTLQVGLGGPGGATGSAGVAGQETNIRINGYHILRLNGAVSGGSAGGASTSGGGGTSAGYFYSNSVGQTGSGVSGAPLATASSALDFLSQGRFLNGGAGGTGSGAGGTTAGSGGIAIGSNGVSVAGASAGGGGGGAPWGRANHVPILSAVGTGGVGGVSGSPGTSANTDTFGGGGGGGGAAAAGGAGGDGFLRIWF